MKKLITLCLFSVALLFNSQNSAAQNTLEINAEANTKTKELRKIIKFDSNKMNDVYKAYEEFGVSKKRINTSDIANSAERLEKINKVLDERLQGILSEEQYVTYLKYFRDR